MHIEYRVEMRCTPEHLWPLIDDVEKQKLWFTTLVEVTATSALARAVGSTFDMRVREGRRISRYEGRINAYDPPRHLGVSFWGGRFAPGIVMQVDYRLADLGKSTRVEYYAKIDTESLSGPVKLAIPIARVFTFFQVRYFMRNLKRLAEAPRRSAASQLESAGHSR
jgi:carbon monoxide dehydrogenase subunit G